MKEDKKRNIWIGTANNGLIKYDSTFTFFNNKNTPIKGNYISALEFDKNDKIWFAFKSNNKLADSKTAGLACFANGKIETFNTNNSGLTCNTINSIAVDSNNVKWFATENCIISYDENLNKWEKHFDKEKEIRKIDTIKYNSRSQYLHYAKKLDSKTESWESTKPRDARSPFNPDFEPTTRYYRTTTYYENPLNYYNIEILHDNSKLIRSFGYGTCIYNNQKWDSNTDTSNRKYIETLLKEKLKINETLLFYFIEKI
jgi:hypothetical protein